MIDAWWYGPAIVVVMVVFRFFYTAWLVIYPFVAMALI